MELQHRFTVPAPVEQTWSAFNDIESVAGCFPGATVTSVDGDDFQGTCKVKLGPIALTYSGSGTFVERDEAAYRFVIEAKGKDKRGNGTAAATVTAVLSAEAADRTAVEVGTDLAITGKPAQFGRGVIQDVSDKLLQQFVDCLQSKVGAPQQGETEPEPEGPPEPAAQPAAQPGAEPAPQPAAEPARQTAASSMDGQDALDLGATVLPALARAYWKQAAGVLLALLVLRRLLRGRRK
ncbi:MAG TPA: SRPBCC family protein [Nocardioidaceae bacterium]|nr:SRPBCC family protein [Nocardioidaceae bacterium]